MATEYLDKTGLQKLVQLVQEMPDDATLEFVAGKLRVKSPLPVVNGGTGVASLEAFAELLNDKFLLSDVSIVQWRYLDKTLNAKAQRLQVDSNAINYVMGNAFSLAPSGTEVVCKGNGPGLLLRSSHIYVTTNATETKSSVQVDFYTSGAMSAFSIGDYDLSYNGVQLGAIGTEGTIHTTAAKWSGTPTRMVDGSQCSNFAVHIPVKTQAFEDYFNGS